jgi:hypothetical protein
MTPGHPGALSPRKHVTLRHQSTNSLVAGTQRGQPSVVVTGGVNRNTLSLRRLSHCADITGPSAPPSTSPSPLALAMDPYHAVRFSASWS